MKINSLVNIVTRCSPTETSSRVISEIKARKLSIAHFVVMSSSVNQTCTTRCKISTRALTVTKNFHRLYFYLSSQLEAQSRAAPISSIIALDPWMFPVHRMDLRLLLTLLLLPFMCRVTLLVLFSESFLLEPGNLREVERATQYVEWKVLEGSLHYSASDIPMPFPLVISQTILVYFN